MKTLSEIFGIEKPSSEDSLKNALSCCDSVADMLTILNSRYELENCKPGTLTKTAVVDGLVKAVAMLNPKPR